MRLGLRGKHVRICRAETGRHAYRAKRSTLGEGGLVSLGILVVFIPATVAGNNENTEDVSHDGRVVGSKSD